MNDKYGVLACGRAYIRRVTSGKLWLNMQYTCIPHRITIWGVWLLRIFSGIFLARS
eukprot:UN21505